LKGVLSGFEYAALDGRERLVSYFYWLGPDSVRGLLAPELRSALPDGMKQRGRTGTWVFKKAMEPSLPLDVIYR